MPSDPVKHHFVPQFLINKFADSKGRITAHRLRADTSFATNARDIGHRNDGHTLYLRSGKVDRSSLEEAMGGIEREAAEVVAELDQGGSLDESQRRALAWFISLQWTRHRYVLNQLLSRSGDHSDLSREEVQTGLLRVALGPLLAAWQVRDDESAHYKDRWNYIVGAALSFNWKVLRFSEDSLVLGDTTVCMSGVRPGEKPEYNTAWARHGIGVGWESVARVTMPLTPRLGLLLTREGRPDRLRASAFNRTTVFNAREFVLHGRDREPTTNGLLTSFNEDLERQRYLAPIFGEEGL
jgi:hypothetical protein